MTKALYDRIGADRGAGPDALRAAYTRTVAQIVRRRRALVEQGGDTGPLDLERARADEAWALLSDPVRRRRYDALLSLGEDGDLPRGEALWTQVVGSLASPAAAAAVDVVRALTHLQVGQLPGPADLAPDRPTAVDSERTAPPDTQADIPTQADTQPAREMPSVRLASPADASPSPVSSAPPKVVPFSMTPSLRKRGPTPTPTFAQAEPSDADADATPVPAAGQVVRIPAQPMPTSSGTGSQDSEGGGFDVDALIAEHGWSGSLLRAVRERRGLSLRDIGASTRISARYLDAIEQDEHAQLPSATFVKGYLREIARTLGLDETALVQGYMRRME